MLKKEKIISISIQNGMRTKVGDIFSLLKSYNKTLGCDYLLTMNTATGIEYLNFIKSKNRFIKSKSRFSISENSRTEEGSFFKSFLILVMHFSLYSFL